MRMFLTGALLVVAAATLTACTTSDDFDTKLKPQITVLFTDNATAEQKSAVETKVRALPGVDSVRFESSDEAQAHAQDQLKDDPSLAAAVAGVPLPPSLRFTTKDLTSYDAIRKSTFANDVKQMDGVTDVVIQCATLDECKKTLTPPPTR
ncbi:permease-like cell division protein FtsX [Dactylosporangium sp. CS-047395]|uniref:permease-like cell division protein FtsX n=1 Tax=Dactylosporangium sp. CS-047395 TaxID=3239936 RepID=UPI003D8C6B86